MRKLHDLLAPSLMSAKVSRRMALCRFAGDADDSDERVQRVQRVRR